MDEPHYQSVAEANAPVINSKKARRIQVKTNVERERAAQLRHTNDILRNDLDRIRHDCSQHTDAINQTQRDLVAAKHQLLALQTRYTALMIRLQPLHQQQLPQQQQPQASQSSSSSSSTSSSSTGATATTSNDGVAPMVIASKSSTDGNTSPSLSSQAAPSASSSSSTDAPSSSSSESITVSSSSHSIPTLSSLPPASSSSSAAATTTTTSSETDSKRSTAAAVISSSDRWSHPRAESFEQLRADTIRLALLIGQVLNDPIDIPGYAIEPTISNAALRINDIRELEADIKAKEATINGTLIHPLYCR
jgi:hypothetical protein